jgi:ABC-type uncharacterized transport system substrate-binding protein
LGGEPVRTVGGTGCRTGSQSSGRDRHERWASSSSGGAGSDSDIPIVFASGSDPVRDGLVNSFDRPGGNATGVYVYTTSLGPKRLELLRDLVPQSRVIAFLVNNSNPIFEMEVRQIEEAARAIGQNIIVLNVSSDMEIDLVAGFNQFERIG